MWTIEWGDVLYRIVAPDGTESISVHFCEPVTLEYEDGFFLCFLHGEEDDDMTVYDISQWPKMTPVPTQEDETEFDGEDGKETEVECPKCKDEPCDQCGGNGFIFVPAGEVIDVEAQS